MEEEALGVHESKMTRENASGYAKSTHGFMNFRKSPPFLQRGAVLVDGKPHTSPQPAALTCTTVHNSPTPGARGHSGQHVNSPPATSFQPSLVVPFSTHQLPQTPVSLLPLYLSESHYILSTHFPSSRQNVCSPILPLPLKCSLDRKPGDTFPALLPIICALCVQGIPDGLLGLLLSLGTLFFPSLILSSSSLHITFLSCPLLFFFFAPSGSLVDLYYLLSL